MAKIAKTAAAPPTAAPFASREIFCEISALASSISSRTSSEARSEISLTASAMREAVLWSVSVVTAQSLQDHGRHEAAGKGGADEQLGVVGRRGVDARRTGGGPVVRF